MPEGKAFARLLKRYYWRVTKRKEQHGLSSYAPVRPVAVDLCTAPQDTEGSCIQSGLIYSLGFAQHTSVTSCDCTT